MTDGFRAFDPVAMDATQAYHLLNALVVPRPIAWVSTLGERGVANIAPHSYFTVLAPDPPTVCFSSGGVKDSLRNVRFTGDFAVNIVSEELGEAMNLTSADCPPDESEFAAAGLTPVPCDLIRAPRLLEAPASMECRLVQVIEIGRAPNHVVVGEAVHLGEFIQMPRPTYAGLVAAGLVGAPDSPTPAGD